MGALRVVELPGGFTFLVHPLKIAEFVRAAGIAEPPAPLAPLGFSRTSPLQEPVEAPVSRWLGVSPSSLRHAEHEWTCHAPLLAGREYQVSGWTVGGDRSTVSRTGAPLRFVTLDRRFHDGAGALVLDERMTVVVVGHPPAARADVTSVALGAPDVTSARVAERTVGPFTVTDFVRFAGAVGDFTPIHHDRAAASAVGLPDVIAMGMLSGAILLDLAARELGVDRVRCYGLRFVSGLGAGEELTMVATAGEANRVELTATAGGRPVLRGYAQV